MREFLHRPLPGSARLSAIGAAHPLRLWVAGYASCAVFVAAAALILN